MMNLIGKREGTFFRVFVLGGVVFSFNRTCMPLWATDCGVVCLGDVRCKTNTKHQIDAIPPRAAVRVGLRICVGRTSRRRCRDFKLLPDAIFAHHKNSGMSDVKSARSLAAPA